MLKLVGRWRGLHTAPSPYGLPMEVMLTLLSPLLRGTGSYAIRIIPHVSELGRPHTLRLLLTDARGV